MQRIQAVLTPSQSKRLIAKGVLSLSVVKRALKNGTVTIAKGTTNSYVVEELGFRLDKRTYVTGHVVPRGVDSGQLGINRDHPDLVLRNGSPVGGLTAIAAVKDMRPGDVFIKGANALNYSDRIAGILAGGEGGGTIGSVWGLVLANRIELVIPVGLEKCVAMPVQEVSLKLREAQPDWDPDIPRLFPVTGYIVTEIEALEALFGVRAWHIASGGIAGAEGSVRLLVEGDSDQIGRVRELLEQLKDEPAFIQ